MDGSAKVIITASGLHQGHIDFEDIEFRNKFSGFKSYRQSKLGVILLTKHLANAEPKIGYYAVHPGVVNTKLGRNANWLSNLIFRLIGKSKKKGASTHLYLIDQDNSELHSGGYYANARLTQSSKESNNMRTAKKLHAVVESYIKRSTP